jgi:hypothetical protein
LLRVFSLDILIFHSGSVNCALALFADMTESIDAFTLRAVGQEDFSDVVVPEAPAAPKQQQQK